MYTLALLLKIGEVFMQKILVTGAGGFLASRFYEVYKNKYDIISLKRGDLDITDEAKVIETIRDAKPDYVLHTAALADTGKCEENKELSFAINVKGSINIAKACSLSKAKLLHFSTEQIFNGNVEAGPYSEKSIPVANTTYGKHKLQAEEEIKNILEEAWILRLTWMFGLPERFKKVNSNIVWNVVSAAIKGNSLKIPTNEFRGMTYAYDLLKNIPNIIKVPYGIYNTGSENNLSTYDIAKLVVEELGLSYRIENIIQKDEERYKDLPRDIRISNKKFRNLGIEFLSTEKAIKQCVNDFGMRF
ncbi:SDR family oxidoreductase [Clostridium swellfunianum]|uniref:SDR family oxidoreductase n=1 Tax=Clostridium swellfunianum TaxID=1367462 RepID=UPI0032D59CE2